MNEPARQVEALARGMELDAVVLGLPANVLWLSGFDMVGTFYFTAALVAGAEPPALLVHRAEVDMARDEAHLDDIVPWGHGQDHVAALVEWLAARIGSPDGRRVGVELDEWLRPRDLDEIAARAGLEWVDVGPRVEELRASLAAPDRAASAEAGRVADMAFAAGVGAVAPGLTEHHVAAHALRTYLLAGGQEPAVPLSVRSGERLAMGRALPSDRIIGAGDAVGIEVWASLRRRAAVTAGTVVAGPPSEALVRAFAGVDAVLDLFEREPALGPELRERALAELRPAGLDLRTPLTFGLAFPFPLRPVTRGPDRLAPGRVVVVAPGVQAEGAAAFAARTYLMEAGEVRPLTHRPRLWSLPS